MRMVSPEEAVSVVRSRHQVYVHAAAAVPSVLLGALVARASELEEVRVVHLHVEGPGPHLAPEMEGHFRHVALFIGPNARAAVNEGRAEYVPVFLHDTVDLSRWTSPARSARTPSATGCTAASGARWTSSGGRRWRRGDVLPHRAGPPGGGRGGHHQGPRPDRGHRARGGRAVRPEHRGAGPGAYRRGPPRLPRGPRGPGPQGQLPVTSKPADAGPGRHGSRRLLACAGRRQQGRVRVIPSGHLPRRIEASSASPPPELSAEAFLRVREEHRMPKSEKLEKVSELTERIRGSRAMFIADYRGLTVADVTELRRTLRESGARFTVAKNTLLRRAAGEAGVDGLDDLLQGPTAVAFVDSDPITAAKSLVDAIRRFRTLEIRGGFMEGRVMTSAEAQNLATIEPREVLLAKLAGAMKAEMSRAAYMLQALQSRFLSVLEAYREKVPAGEAPAGEEPAAEAEEVPAEEAGTEVEETAPEADVPEEATEAGVPEEATEEEASTDEEPAAEAAGEEGKE